MEKKCAKCGSPIKRHSEWWYKNKGEYIGLSCWEKIKEQWREEKKERIEELKKIQLKEDLKSQFQPKGRVEIDVFLYYEYKVETDWGEKIVYFLKDYEGNIYSWKTNSHLYLQVSEILSPDDYLNAESSLAAYRYVYSKNPMKIKATITGGYTKSNGVNVNTIARVKVIDAKILTIKN